MADRRPKVIAIASRGGHWIQLLRLRRAFEGAETIYVTTVTDYRAMVGGAGFRTVAEATRSQKIRLLLCAFQIFLIILRERPDAVVTTGAAPGFFAIVFGKWLGVKTLWIDSIANADELSLSGRLASRHADDVLTQWEHLAIGAIEYRGAVI